MVWISLAGHRVGLRLDISAGLTARFLYVIRASGIAYAHVKLRLLRSRQSCCTKNKKTVDIVTGDNKISVYLYNNFGRFDKFISLISTYDVLFRGTLQISKESCKAIFGKERDLIFCKLYRQKESYNAGVINCKIGITNLICSNAVEKFNPIG